MSVPDFQTIMLPLLRLTADGQERRLKEAADALATEFGLTEEERRELLPSGRQGKLRNRVSWSRTYLAKAGLLEVTGRGRFRITQRGLDVLAEEPHRIDIRFLARFPEFIEFRGGNQEVDPTPPDQPVDPAESLALAYGTIREALVGELLKQVMSCSSDFFEKLVVALLVRMGYGGSLRDAGETVGQTGDGGIDGTIKQDPLGLDMVYVQAKRWANSVSRPEIQKFVGALQGKQARKGVFITTSSFSSGAIDYAERVESNVVLIDGQQLGELMVDFGVGVTPEETYEIKRIDFDFFAEE